MTKKTLFTGMLILLVTLSVLSTMAAGPKPPRLPGESARIMIPFVKRSSVSTEPLPVMISGVVRDTYNNPVPGVEITTLEVYGPPIKATTDQNGNFLLSFPVNGSYTLVASLEGYRFMPSIQGVNIPGETGTITFRAVYLGDQVPVYMGYFEMGCERSNPDNFCRDTELPLHGVPLTSYYIDRLEVTNAQYMTCVLAGVCTLPLTSWSNTRMDYIYIPSYYNFPVINVTWYQANQFCQWVGKKLPTEAQWEKAARGTGDLRVFPWGFFQPSCLLMNYDGANCFNDTVQGGSFPLGASPYGVLDMSGNVAEWTNDWFSEQYYNTYAVEEWPYDPTGPANGTLRAFRGGSWNDSVVPNRLVYRSGLQPIQARNDIGFRCVSP